MNVNAAIIKRGAKGKTKNSLNYQKKEKGTRKKTQMQPTQRPRRASADSSGSSVTFGRSKQCIRQRALEMQENVDCIAKCQDYVRATRSRQLDRSVGRMSTPPGETPLRRNYVRSPVSPPTGNAVPKPVIIVHELSCLSPENCETPYSPPQPCARMQQQFATPSPVRSSSLGPTLSTEPTAPILLSCHQTHSSTASPPPSPVRRQSLGPKISGERTAPIRLSRHQTQSSPGSSKSSIGNCSAAEPSQLADPLDTLTLPPRTMRCSTFRDVTMLKRYYRGCKNLLNWLADGIRNQPLQCGVGCLTLGLVLAFLALNCEFEGLMYPRTKI